MRNRTDDPGDVVVVTGVDGMGSAVARRLGSGRTLILADQSRERLDQVVAERGRITAVVHTPVSPPRRPRSAGSSTWTCSARCT
ncbi:hypothetical protein [Streptomyces swartbergensis]|uniref:hypothetical protein n=1 Tax=Streptomyces swartbergensis TaxID=487165 RepID=UPI00380DC7E4